MKYYIQNYSFNINFERQENIRTKLFDIETKLSSLFTQPFNLNPVPENTPGEVPRIMAKSIEGNGNLHVSQVNMSTTFQSDVKRLPSNTEVLEHLALLSSSMYATLSDLEIDVLLYSGATISFYIPMNSNDDALNHLQQKFLSSANASNFTDINFKLTFKEQEKYYVNYSFANKIEYTTSGPTPRMIPAYLKPVSYGISLILDMNDRHAFNYSREYVSDANEGNIILNRMSSLIENDLVEVIEKGIFHHSK